jgi:hypothetical protein
LYIRPGYYNSYWSFNGNLRVQIKRILSILMFNKALTIRIHFYICVHVNTVHIWVSAEIWVFRYSGYRQYWRSIWPSQLEYCFVSCPRKYSSYWSFNGNLRVQIQWILIILSLSKALWIKMLYSIYGHVTTVYIGVLTEIWGYRYSGYWEYWRSISPSQLEYCFTYMSTLIQFVLEFQRKYEGTDTVTIENIVVQYGPLD